MLLKTNIVKSHNRLQKTTTPQNNNEYIKKPNFKQLYETTLLKAL